MEQQKQKLQDQFNDTYKRRDDLMIKKEQAAKLEKDN